MRSCRASTSLAPLYSLHARLAFGWGVKSPLPLRASSRGVLPGTGALVGCRTPNQALGFTKGSSCFKNEIETTVLPRSPCAGPLKLPPSPTKSREMAHGLVSDALENGSHRCVPLDFFTASQITNHLVSLTSATFSPPPAQRRRTKNIRDGRISDTRAWSHGL